MLKRLITLIIMIVVAVLLSNFVFSNVLPYFGLSLSTTARSVGSLLVGLFCGILSGPISELI